MKRLLLLLTLAMVAGFSFAAVAGYSWGYSSGTYQEIVGGTQLGGASVDDTSYNNIALPFTFVYDGVSYTSFSVNANGFIAMGATISSSYTPLSTGSSNNVIAALSRDIKGRTDGDLRWEVIGTPGSRELVVQWKNYARYQSTITVTDNFNFQIRLLEGSNQIKILYGSFIVDATDMLSYPQVGLRGAANTDYKNRTTTTNWAASTSGTSNAATMTLITSVFPASGTTYTFSPPDPNVPPFPASLVNPPIGGTVNVSPTLQWSPTGGVIEGYKLYFGTDGAGVTPPTSLVNGTNLGLVTSYLHPSFLEPGTTYYWQIVPWNTLGGDATGCPIWTFTTGYPLTGTKIIGTVEPYDYQTFTAAINALNALGTGTGGVTFTVQNGTYAENPPAITASGTTANPITFQPVTGANPVLTPAGGTGTYGFKLEGADYVTFDNIDVNGPNTLIYGYWVNGLAGNGATNNVIKNSTITVPYGTSTNYGIYANQVDVPNSNCTYMNNAIVNPYNGIYLVGNSTAGNESQGLNVQGNTLSGIRNNGVYMSQAQNSQIQYNNIGFFAGGTVANNGIYVFGTTSAISIHHNAINGGYTSSTVYGFYQSSGNHSWEYNTLTNLYNTSSSTWYGFYLSGGEAICSNNAVYGVANTGTGTTGGAYISTGNHQFIRNQIYDIASGSTSLYGIYVIGGTTHTLNGNKIYNLRYTGASSGIIYGIHIGSGTTNNVYNNMVYDLRAPASTGTAPQIRAISISSGTTDNIWNNSVYLNSTGTGSTFSTAALYVSGGTTIDLKNNIFVNQSTPGASGRSVAFWKTTAGVSNLSATSDKNMYFTVEPPTATMPMGYFLSTTYETLAAYKTMAATKDQASYWENAPYVSITDPYDLHLRTNVATRAEGNAIPIQPPVTMDIDNQTRNSSTPDIGADEGAFTPVQGVPGQVTLLSPANGATGIDPISVPVSWSPPTAGGTPLSYYVFVSTMGGGDFFDNQIGYDEVAYPATSFDLATITGLALEPFTEYFWAVQAHNAQGDSDPEDPAFQIWSFTTMQRLTAPATLALGNTWPLSPKTGTIAVSNHGPGTMTFNASGPAEFVFGGTRFSVPEYSTYNLPYTFTPPAVTGPYSAQITLTETDPGTSSVLIDVTANVTTDVTVGNGTTNLQLPVNPFYKTSYSQSIYYPSEISYPAGYRIERVYYYYNGAGTCLYTKDFVIYMGHTTTSTFEATTSWLPISGLTQVYNNVNIPQAAPGGYWMEFVLDTPFIYDGVSNLVIAVEENVITTTYDSSSYFFHSTDTPGINRSILHYSDTDDANPATPPTTSVYLRAGYPNLKLGVGVIPTTPAMSLNPTQWNFGTLYTTSAPVTQNITVSNSGTGSLGITNISYTGAAAFTLVNVPSMPFYLSSGQTATFGVQFNPSTEGSFTGTVSVYNDLRQMQTVAISGSSVDISGGYRYANSFQTTAPSYPTYNWIDISATGTEIIGLTDDSSTATAIPLGMTFPFFGVNMTDVFVNSNGFLSFGVGSSSLSNTALPNTGVPNNIIAFFWEDMNPNSTTVTDDWIKYQTVDGNFVITFYKLPRYGGDVNNWLTAQLILYPSGKIKIQYQAMGATLPLNSFTVGIENETGLIGVQYQFDGTGLPIFGPAGEPLALAFGQGDLSDPTLALDAPVISSVIPAGADIEIVWNAVTGAGGYKIYGSNDPYAPMPWALVTTVPSSQTQALVPATAAYKFYYVTAYSGTRAESPAPFKRSRN